MFKCFTAPPRARSGAQRWPRSAKSPDASRPGGGWTATGLGDNLATPSAAETTSTKVINGSHGVGTSTEAFAETVTGCRTWIVAASRGRDLVRRRDLGRRHRGVLGAHSGIHAAESRCPSVRTPRSSRRASRAPYRPTSTWSPAPRFTDNPERVIAPSESSSGASEKFGTSRGPH